MQINKYSVNLKFRPYFNLLDFFLGLAVIGFILITFPLVPLLEGDFNIKYDTTTAVYFTIPGLILLFFGLVMAFNSELIYVLYFDKGFVQRHFVFWGKSFPRTTINKSLVEAVAVDCIIDPQHKFAVSDGETPLVYPVFFLDKAGKKRYISYHRDLAEANDLAQNIAENWKIPIFKGRVSGHTILSKGSNNKTTITFSSKPPSSWNKDIPSSTFFMASFTLVVVAVVSLMLVLRWLI